MPEQNDELSAVMQDIAAELRADLGIAERRLTTITTDREAAWAAERIVEAKAAIATHSEFLKTAKVRLSRLEWLFKEQLHAWAESRTEKGARRAKLGTAVGQFTKVPETIRIVDKAATIEWSEEHCPAAIKLDPRLVKGPLMEHLDKTGEIGDGCELVAAHDSFSVRPGREKAKAAEAEEQTCREPSSQ